MVRAKPRRWERASSIVLLADFCFFLVSSRVTTSGTIESIVSSTMARMLSLNDWFCSPFLSSRACASASVSAEIWGEVLGGLGASVDTGTYLRGPRCVPNQKRV